jgi:hypothetical protein
MAFERGNLERCRSIWDPYRPFSARGREASCALAPCVLSFDISCMLHWFFAWSGQGVCSWPRADSGAHVRRQKDNTTNLQTHSFWGAAPFLNPLPFPPLSTLSVTQCMQANAHMADESSIWRQFWSKWCSLCDLLLRCNNSSGLLPLLYLLLLALSNLQLVPFPIITHSQSAAGTVASFLRLPPTLGTGKNLELFTSRLEAMQGLRDRVSG